MRLCVGLLISVSCLGLGGISSRANVISPKIKLCLSGIDATLENKVILLYLKQWSVYRRI